MPDLVPFHNIYRCLNEELADPPVLVLLHGWGMHSIVWDDIMYGLLQQFQVMVVDLPGMGQSPLPAGDYTLDFLVEKLLPILPERAVVLGWSLGGMVGIRLASRYPEKVSRLITVATSPSFVQRDDWPCAMARPVLDKFIEVFGEDAEGTLIRFLALQCKGSLSQKTDTRKLKDILYFCGLPARKALRGGLEILRDEDLREELAALAVPRTHIFGQQDHLVPVAIMAELEKQVPGADLALIEGVSHVPFISDPDLFLQVLGDSLGKDLAIPEAIKQQLQAEATRQGAPGS